MLKPNGYRMLDSAYKFYMNLGRDPNSDKFNGFAGPGPCLQPGINRRGDQRSEDGNLLHGKLTTVHRDTLPRYFMDESMKTPAGFIRFAGVYYWTGFPVNLE